MALVAARELDHQPQVRVDQPFLGFEIAALDALRELDLLLTRQERMAAGLVEEELEAIGRLGGLRCGAMRRASALDLVATRRLDRVLSAHASRLAARACSASGPRHGSPFLGHLLYKV